MEGGASRVLASVINTISYRLVSNEEYRTGQETVQVKLEPVPVKYH